jgi:hypothetical protein
MVMLIAAISSYIGVGKILRIEPFDIFRGQGQRPLRPRSNSGQ